MEFGITHPIPYFCFVCCFFGCFFGCGGVAQVEVEQKSEVSFGIDGYSSMTVDYSQLFTTMIEGDDLSETIDPARSGILKI